MLVVQEPLRRQVIDLSQSKSLNLAEHIDKFRAKGKLGCMGSGSCVRPVDGDCRVHLACGGCGVQLSPQDLSRSEPRGARATAETAAISAGEEW